MSTEDINKDKTRFKLLGIKVASQGNEVLVRAIVNMDPGNKRQCIM